MLSIWTNSGLLKNLFVPYLEFWSINWWANGTSAHVCWWQIPSIVFTCQYHNTDSLFTCRLSVIMVQHQHTNLLITPVVPNINKDAVALIILTLRSRFNLDRFSGFWTKRYKVLNTIKRMRVFFLAFNYERNFFWNGESIFSAF